MINFNKIPYKRITIEEIKNKVNLLSKSNDINTIKSAIEFIKQVDQQYDYIDINNMRNETDEFFINEMNYLNKIKPDVEIIFTNYYQRLIDKNLSIVQKYFPGNFIKLINCQKHINNPCIKPFIDKDNLLKKEYRTLSLEKVLYDNKLLSKKELSKYLISSNRSVRKKAHDALNDFYYQNQEKYDELLFSMIENRNNLSSSLGMKNYVEYSLYHLKRIDYNYTDIKKFRDGVVMYFTPLNDKINDLTKKLTNLTTLEYYDSILFTESPKLKYQARELLDKFSISLNFDKDLQEVYQNLLNNGYIDMEQRYNKVNFCITNYLTKISKPVITGNFSNTYKDVKSLSHEFGHAYQKYLASIEDENHIVPPLLKYPTMEVAEMFSFSSELILADKIENLFVSTTDYDKYLISLYVSFIKDISYICLVDEFQEIIYKNKNLAISDIRVTWLNLAKKYHLDKTYRGHINLKEGGYFYRQTHIYLNPFYYIDYALSYFGAFSIYEGGLDKFRILAPVASYYPLKDLIHKYNIPSPFEGMNIKNMSISLSNKIEQLVKKYEEDL